MARVYCSNCAMVKISLQGQERRHDRGRRYTIRAWRGGHGTRSNRIAPRTPDREPLVTPRIVNHSHGDAFAAIAM
jgi:hypothetical protein